MIDKIKQYASYVLGLAVLILSALFLRQSRKTDAVESELAHEKTSTEIKLNDQARKAARDTANDLVESYERLKRDD